MKGFTWQEIEKKDMDIERLDALAFERLQIIAEQAQQIATLEEKLVATETSASKEIAELKAKVKRLKTISTVEMMCENENVKHHVTEWENRCLKAEVEVEALNGQRRQIDALSARDRFKED